jgi:hypothetical protein
VEILDLLASRGGSKVAEAKITTPDGISVEVSGTPEEVSTIVRRLRSGSSGTALQTRRGKKELKAQEGSAPGKVLISDLIETMKREDFFKSPRGLGEVRQGLADMGHHYPVTTLSGAMQKLAKRRQLRRFKQDGMYVYVRC